MKKVMVVILVLVLLLTVAACGKTKELHCDRCGKVCEVEEKSNMTEEWIIFCNECEEEAFKDNPVVQ